MNCRPNNVTPPTTVKANWNKASPELAVAKLKLTWTELFAIFCCSLRPFNDHNKTAEYYGDWYTCRWWVGCYIWYSEERPGRAEAPPSPLLAVPNVTAHPSTASTNFILFDVALLLPLNSTGLTILCVRRRCAAVAIMIISLSRRTRHSDHARS